MSTIILSEHVASNESAWEALDAAVAASCAIEEYQDENGKMSCNMKKRGGKSMKRSLPLSMANLPSSLQTAPSTRSSSPTSSLYELLDTLGEAERLMGEVDDDVHDPSKEQETPVTKETNKEFGYEYDATWNEFCDGLSLDE